MLWNKTNEINRYGPGSNSYYNYQALQVLIFISMLYVCCLFFSTTFIGYNIEIHHLPLIGAIPSIFILGGTFTSPPYFILGDITAEIYGSRIAQQLVAGAFVIASLFALIAQIIIHSDAPYGLKNHNAEFFIVFSPLLVMTLKSFFAYMVSSFVNIHVISWWKGLLRGKKYWLRSICTSTVAEALYSLIAIMIMELGNLDVNHMIRSIIASYIIKLLFSLCTAYHCQKLVNFLKKYTKLDMYKGSMFNPTVNLVVPPELEMEKI